MKILAVDDDPIFLDLLQKVLSELGLNQLTAFENGFEALAAVETEDLAAECFILDISMPEMDGVELCSRIRALPHHKFTPILMLTALLDDATVDRAFMAGATDYIPKPLRGLELVARIRTAILMHERMQTVANAQKTALQLQARLDSIIASANGETLDILGGDHTVTYPQMEEMLTTLPEGVYAMSAFVLRIEEGDSLRQTLAPADFKTMLAEVSALISARLGQSTHFIAYCGDGLFSCLVQGRDYHLSRDKRGERYQDIWHLDLMQSGKDLRSVRLKRCNAQPALRLLSGRKALEILRRDIRIGREIMPQMPPDDFATSSESGKLQRFGNAL